MAGPTKEQVLIGGVYHAAGITLQDGQTAPLQLAADGTLLGSGGGGGGGNVVITDPTSIQSGVNGVTVYIYDPGTGLPLTYSGATTVTGTGTAGTADTGVQTVQGIAAMTPLLVSGTGTAGSAAAAVTTVQGIASMTPLIVQGDAASGAAVAGNPLLSGGKASVSSTPPTAVTDGQAVALMTTDTGKLVVKPFAVKEAEWRGTISGTSGALTVSNSSNASLKTYVTAMQVFNTSATIGTIAFNDTGASVIGLPASGGNTVTFPTPLVTSATNTSLIGTITGAGATVTITAQGYFGG